jgi:hypothetical protein
MPRDHQHNPDPNANAARIVTEAIAGTSDATPASVEASVEAAWQAWAAHVQKVDERGMTLLKAAFEAGWEAGNKRR